MPRTEPYDPSTFNTGDLLLCHSTPDTDPIGGEIERVTGSLFSHMAMVLRAGDGSLSAWQSIAPDGVGVSPLLPFLQQYQASTKTPVPVICVRRLAIGKGKLDPAKLQQFIKSVNGRPFCGIFAFLENILRGRFGLDPLDDSFFCSQLVAATYQAIGLLHTKHPANWYAPASFSEEDVHLQLELGASLGEQIWLIVPPGTA